MLIEITKIQLIFKGLAFLDKDDFHR